MIKGIFSKIGLLYLGAIAVTTIAAFAFIRLDLSRSSDEAMLQFVQANKTELAAGDTLLLASKLNALLVSENVRCITGLLGKNEFVHYSKGSCDASLWVAKSSFNSSTVAGLRIFVSFTFSDLQIFSFVCLVLGETLLLLLLLKLNKEKIEIVENSKMAILNMSRQVAHDIRSPLSALNIVVSSLAFTSDEQKVITDNAILRINDIANDLLGKKDFPQKNLSERGIEIPFAQLLLNIVNEKRTLHSAYAKLEIVTDFDSMFKARVTSTVEQSILSRVISNLLNNSVEALPDKVGQVIVSLRDYSSQIVISVSDNGKGIPDELLAKLGKEMISLGKDNLESGSGLGIYNAKQEVESWGGSLIIKSKIGVGTIIEIVIPKK